MQLQLMPVWPGTAHSHLSPQGPEGTGSARLAQGKKCKATCEQDGMGICPDVPVCHLCGQSRRQVLFLGVRAYIFQPSSESPTTPTPPPPPTQQAAIHNRQAPLKIDKGMKTSGRTQTRRGERERESRRGVHCFCWG